MLKQSGISLRKHPTYKKVKDHSKTQPWFDDECKNIKKHPQKLAKLRKLHSQRLDIRIDLPQKQKELKFMSRRKKRSFNMKQVRALGEYYNQPKKVLKGIRKLCRTRENSGTPNIDVENCETHFKNTLQTGRFVAKANESLSAGPFDAEISEEEIFSILKSLKTNKSSGLDQINNEIIPCLYEAHLSLLKNLFNNILQRGHLPKQWNKSLIVPIRIFKYSNQVHQTTLTITVEYRLCRT